MKIRRKKCPHCRREDKPRRDKIGDLVCSLCGGLILLCPACGAIQPRERAVAYRKGGKGYCDAQCEADGDSAGRKRRLRQEKKDAAAGQLALIR